MVVAKLMPEKELWVSGTTVPTLIKAISYSVTSAVRTTFLKEYVKIMPFTILFTARGSLIAEATDFLCAHFNKP
jgi:hypothetical protein